jgi:hypothetical protein
MEVLKQPVEIRNPQDQDDDHQAIQNRLDLSLHWNEPVHKPQQNTCCNDREEDSSKWHVVYSNHFSDSMPWGIVEKLRSDRLTLRGSHQKEENDYSASLVFFQADGAKAEP